MFILKDKNVLMTYIVHVGACVGIHFGRGFGVWALYFIKLCTNSMFFISQSGVVKQAIHNMANMAWLTSLFVLCISYSVFAEPSLTETQVGQIKKKLTTLISNYKTTGLSRNGFQALIPNIVRLNFHDCVGGCDGCVNLKNSDNLGLGVSIDPLEKLYKDNKYNKLISRADFWVLAGITALELGSQNLRGRCRRTRSCPKPVLKFQYGRKDCKTAPSTSAKRELPNNHGDLAHLKGYLAKEFDFNERETVAILGAHSLGMSRRNNSGFAGPWAPRRAELSNQYYITLSSGEWTQGNVRRRGRNGARYQWNQGGRVGGGGGGGGGNVMMLNPDMALWRKIKVNSQGVSSCTFKSCGESSTASIVREYAKSNTIWLKDFSKAYQKMISSGYKTLKWPVKKTQVG